MKSQIFRVGVVAFAVAAAACTDSVRQGTGSSFLIIDNMQAASGADPGAFSGTLQSDVVTLVESRPTIFHDLGQATFSLGLKDPGRGTTPTQNLAITVDRYNVRYIRADGRNTPGVDVPYPFDGSVTATVAPGGSVSVSFPIVRHVAKQEAPLGGLGASRVIISTIAEVTFYGRDLTGHEVSVTGRISVEFGNFADPAS